MGKLEPEIAKQLRSHISNHPLYHPAHWVSAISHENGISISYAPFSERFKCFHESHFDLQIIGNTCYILGLNIKSSESRKGHGSALCLLIEDFAKSQGCTTMNTTPSGQGKKFWPKMGYIASSDHAFKKSI